jgi:hypothetical protein
VSRVLFNPHNSTTASQVTLDSRAAQPPSTAQGSDVFLRRQPQQSHGPSSLAPTTSSTGQDSWGRPQPSTVSSGAQHYGPPRQPHEPGVLPMSQQSIRDRSVITMPVDPRFPDMLMQPDSRPISQEQLSAEVKSIYAGLVMVESKCIHVDKAQAVAIKDAEKGESKIADDHWQALIALHRTLLHEHHDFFLASQHPSASPALRRLATKYTMPARMWKHGIHSFLELLRYRLPESLEFMISFIYTAYQMMSLLYETVPAFEDTWIECLGDLGRYRMAIEDEDIRDRETWAGVARFWYSKAADRSPEVGRLYHHLAILARPNGLQQLYLYSRSLTSVQIFHSARESILTLFNPLMTSTESSSSRLSKIDTYFIKIHAFLFKKDRLDEIDQLRDGFLDLLDSHIGRVTAKWREQGAYVIIANIGALYDFGNKSSLRRLFDLTRRSQYPTSDPNTQPLTDTADLDPTSQTTFSFALDLLSRTTTLVLRRIGDKNVLPYTHILLSFLSSLASTQSFDSQEHQIGKTIFHAMPWTLLCSFLNTLVRSDLVNPRYESTDFIRPEKGDARPLPEDHLIRGQVWSQTAFPVDWFRESEVDDEERSIEHASTVRDRSERVLWLAYLLASYKQWIHYDSVTKIWSPIPLEPLEPISPVPIIEPQDVQMTDADNISKAANEDSDASLVSDEDSPEMTVLKKEARDAQAPRLTGGTLDVPSSKVSKFQSAQDMMLTRYTVMVVDEKLLLKNPDVFQLLADREYPVVVPQSVLHNLSKSAQAESQDDSQAAQQAVENVREAYATKKNVRILTTSGLDVTQQKLDRVTSPGQESLPETIDDPEEVLIQVVRRATDLSIKEHPKDPSSQARPAILLTEDKLTRIRAGRDKMAAIAPSMMRRIFTGSRRRPSTSGRPKGPRKPDGLRSPVIYTDYMEQ